MDDSYRVAVAACIAHVSAVMAATAAAWQAQEFRHLGDKLGLTPAGLAALGWRIVDERAFGGPLPPVVDAAAGADGVGGEPSEPAPGCCGRVGTRERDRARLPPAARVGPHRLTTEGSPRRSKCGIAALSPSGCARWAPLGDEVVCFDLRLRHPGSLRWAGTRRVACRHLLTEVHRPGATAPGHR